MFQYYIAHECIQDMFFVFVVGDK